VKPRPLIGALLLAVATACGPITTAEPTVPSLGTPVPFESTIFKPASIAPASVVRLEDARPNIILITTDDQPFHTVEQMPTVRDVLMQDGVTFENGFVTTPLCCPSRVSILTGEYVHNHGVFTNDFPTGGAQLYDDSDSYAVWLREAGYRTGYIGKYLNDYDALQPYGRVPPGWDEWFAFLGKNLGEEELASQYFSDYSISNNGAIEQYEAEGSIFSADLLTQTAVDFIGENRDEPFFLTVNYYNPHSPYLWAERHDPQFRLKGELQPPDYRPPNFMEPDVSDKPAYLRNLNPIAVEKIDITYKQILRSLLSVDDGVASMLSALDTAGLSEKTILIYLSDNGMTVGNHRLGVTKNCAYDECARVPFIVYAPGHFAARADAHLVANIDLAPTFAELAGATIPETVDGRSLVALLADAENPWRGAVLIEHWPTNKGVGSLIPEFAAVRTADWKYVEYATGEIELFDLINDPFELENLAGSPDLASIQTDLARELARLTRD
jgi:arylsulfatase A-like enzyme